MISFIVPVKNQLEYTRALVRTVREQNPASEVEWVIVDSGSTDGTLEFCGEIGATVVPFRRQPFNYCAAVNAGVPQASGDVWLIANNDLEFLSGGDLERLEQAFREWPLLAVVSPGRAEAPAELEFVTAGVNGACWAVRPEAYRTWGGLPEEMSGYGYDEAHTGFQCWRHGQALAWLTGWRVLHHGSVTFGPELGSVSSAMRRNLSRLLALLDAADLDEGTPEQIIERLRARERKNAPVRLVVPGEWEDRLDGQGYANVAAVCVGRTVSSAVAWVEGEWDRLRERQWLPWLANELLLQPDAEAVGAHGWYAIREAGLRELGVLTRARAVGPPPSPWVPPLPRHQPTLRERLAATVNDWRKRGAPVPEGW